MARDPLSRLEDIAREARFAIGAVAGVDLPAFAANEEKFRVVLHALTIIGEAVVHLDDGQRRALEAAGVPLAKVRGMRNVLTHEYWQVCADVVHEVASVHLAPLLAGVEKLLTVAPPLAMPCHLRVEPRRTGDLPHELPQNDLAIPLRDAELTSFPPGVRLRGIRSCL